MSAAAEPYDPPLPELPQLREIAEAMELYGGGGEILDATFRTVYFSSAAAATALGLTAEEAKSFYGQSIIRRNIDGTEDDVVRTSRDSALAWGRHNYPIMRGHLEPGEPEFEDVTRRTCDSAESCSPTSRLRVRCRAGSHLAATSNSFAI